MQLTEWMDWSLADRGVDLDGIYYCPHHPEAKLAEFKQDCDCRKPKSGMLLQAIEELNIDPARSIMIGDKNRGSICRPRRKDRTNILVRTGKEVTAKEEDEADNVFRFYADMPSLIFSQKI